MKSLSKRNQGLLVLVAIFSLVGSASVVAQNYTIQQIAGNGQVGLRDGQGKQACFQYPVVGGVDSNGVIIISEWANNDIRKATSTGVVTTVNSIFNGPTGCTLDSMGNIWVTEGNNLTIRMIAPNGQVSTIAGNGTPGFSNGVGTHATFKYPVSVAVDTNGNAFVVDQGNYAIRKISKQGNVSTLAGNGTSGFVDGSGNNAQFVSPGGICIATDGSVYVSDTGANAIRKISPLGTVTTLAGNGSAGQNDGQGTNATFYQPSGIAIDSIGNIYVSDFWNAAIRKVSPTGNVSTVINLGFCGGGIAVDSTGIIYTSDYWNQYVYKIIPSIPAQSTDTFGTGTNQFGIDFVTVGNPGNSNDTTGYGGVPYTYRIGKYTISQNQVDAATRNGLQNVTAGAWSGDQPAANISWYAAAAYVNWLNTSQGYRPAYNLTFTNGAWSMSLWPTTPDTNGNVAWTLGGTNLFRNALCHYFLPSENEWYKAAYYDPNKNGGSAGYWLYPTGNDTAPTPVTSGTTAGTAIYNQGALILPQTGPASVFEAGGLSPYGTMGQGGNVFQWIESFNSYNSGLWGIRGGLWWSSYYDLESIARNYNGYGYSPKSKDNYIGFRVASMDDSGATNPQSISFPAIPTVTLTNGAYSLGATASSGLPVSYAIGDSTVAGITNGTLIPLGVGTTAVVASQSGDTNYLPATPVTNMLVVTLAQQSFTPTPILGEFFGSLPFGLTLPTNASGLPITARIVSGPASLSGTNLILNGTGTVTLVYDAPGNALYAAASVTNSFTVTNGPTNLKSQTVIFKALPTKTFGNTPFTLTGTSSAKLPVTYWSSNTNVVVINGTNAVITGAGSTVITAYQPGDGSTYNPATPVSQTLLVNQAAQKLTLKAPKSVAYGSTPAAITATSSAGLPVTLTSSDTSIATITNSGTNTLLVPTGVGTITLTASQPGNANVGAAIPLGQVVVITPGVQTITFGALPSNTYGTAPITLTATSSAGLPVTFTSSATNVASISGNRLTISGAGSAKITASQTGSGLWAPAKAVTQTLTVAKAPQTISFSSPQTVNFTYGGLVTLAATSSSGLPVAYKSGNTKVLSITGSTCVITGRGTTTVVASQAGGGNYLPAPSVTNTITVQ
jgi:Sulfatase-modifying factor enzyme 1